MREWLFEILEEANESPGPGLLVSFALAAWPAANFDPATGFLEFLLCWVFFTPSVWACVLLFIQEPVRLWFRQRKDAKLTRAQRRYIRRYLKNPKINYKRKRIVLKDGREAMIMGE